MIESIVTKPEAGRLFPAPTWFGIVLLGCLLAELWLLWSMIKFLHNERQSERRKHDGKNDEPNREATDASVNPLLVMGQSGHQSAGFRDCLGHTSVRVLVRIHSLLINVEKLLLNIAAIITGYPLPIFIKRFVFHGCNGLSPNAAPSHAEK